MYLARKEFRISGRPFLESIEDAFRAVRTSLVPVKSEEKRREVILESLSVSK